ncbi:hypothetical protein M2322_004467 [Rhodoblastus acidophilus]|nr:hypothetical protein [Rhodoblastus acidophilus]MCW2318898.1 hypothetical protein [Rhodoblastus acidophilus]
MRTPQFRTSTAAALVLGAALFAPGAANATMPVIDYATLAVDQAMKFIQNQMNNTLSAITSQLGANGPLAQLLGPNTYGSVTTLLQQGFTQIANYQKASVDANSQLIDGQNLAMARYHRDIRNAQIRDEHIVGSTHCAALDGGQAVIAGASKSWQVATSITAVTDKRGEGGIGQPGYYGSAQAAQANNQLHYQRYCNDVEAQAGLCSLSQTPNADQEASALFVSGTLDGQDGVTRANDYATSLIQPIVPGTLRGDQLTSTQGAEAIAKRRAYNARMSLARGVASLAIGVQSPSVTLTSEQQQEMTSEGLTATSTASWLQALMLDTTRRLSSTNYHGQLASMPPASIQREIATELAQTNYLLVQLYKLNLMHATTSAAQLAEAVEHNYQPTFAMPSPNLSN